MTARTAAPGPRGYPVLGHIPQFRTAPLPTVMQGWRTFGPVVRYRLGWSPLYVVTDPALAQRILIDDRSTFIKIYKDPQRPVSLQIVLRNGLVTNGDTDSWRVQRRIIQPMFHRQQLARMGDTMAAATERLLRRWDSLPADCREVNMFDEMTRVSLDIINQTMFSVDIVDSLGTIGPAIELASAYLFARTQNPFSLPLALPTPANRRFRRAVAALDSLLRGIIAERRRSGEQPGDLLDLLLAARDADTGAAMDDEQIRDEVATMFAAGHETTANALTWAWYLLARHPRQLRDLRAELAAVVGDRAPTAADVPDLPLARAVFDEALRLYPSTPLMVREAACATELGGYAVPAGAHVLINLFGIQRDPALWDAPERFDPQRFLPAQAEGRHRLAYLPFGAGPRMCIGAQLSRIEGPLILAMVAQRYDVGLAPGPEPAPELLITMRPKGGRMPLRLVPLPSAP